MRIYVDESGTHGNSNWLIIGMLYVPDHGPLHSALCAIKEDRSYFNKSVRKARYKETHLTGFKNEMDVEVAKAWIDLFLEHSCFFRSIVIDWRVWDGRYFGDAFDPDALKKRRAYKKWAEMLLEPEVRRFREATLYLDRLRILYGYDILPHLQERFAPPRANVRPYISRYLASDSWTDAMQCLQLADLLTGSIGQRLTPSSPAKRAAAEYLFEKVKPYQPRATWGAYGKNIVARAPKFSEWFWQPDRKKQKSTKKR